MTVGELWEDFLALQVWQAVVIWMAATFMAAFLGTFIREAAKDLGRWSGKRRA